VTMHHEKWDFRNLDLGKYVIRNFKHFLLNSYYL